MIKTVKQARRTWRGEHTWMKLPRPTEPDFFSILEFEKHPIQLGRKLKIKKLPSGEVQKTPFKFFTVRPLVCFSMMVLVEFHMHLFDLPIKIKYGVPDLQFFLGKEHDHLSFERSVSDCFWRVIVASISNSAYYQAKRFRVKFVF